MQLTVAPESRGYLSPHCPVGCLARLSVSSLHPACQLGPLPELSSEHAIDYEIAVNGVVLSSYTYKKSYTQSRSLWDNKDTTDGLGKDGLEWAKSTFDQFLKDSQSDPKLAGLVSEYEFYFGNAQ